MRDGTLWAEDFIGIVLANRELKGRMRTATLMFSDIFVAGGRGGPQVARKWEVKSKLKS